MLPEAVISFREADAPIHEPVTKFASWLVSMAEGMIAAASAISNAYGLRQPRELDAGLRRPC